MMSGIWDRIRKLFHEAAESSASNPLIHTVLKRDEVYLSDFAQWQDGLVKRRLLDWLGNQYAIYKVLPRDIDEAMDFLNTPSSKGFVIHFYKTNYNRQEVSFFFDLLKERIRVLNYKLQISDTRTYNQKNWVETVDRYYLKPRPDFKEGRKLDQRFGNVTISLVFRDEQVYQLKLQATVYVDHQYRQAEEFSALMQALLR